MHMYSYIAIFIQVSFVIKVYPAKIFTNNYINKKKCSGLAKIYALPILKFRKYDNYSQLFFKCSVSVNSGVFFACFFVFFLVIIASDRKL